MLLLSNIPYGFGYKTGCPIWVAHPMTHTRSFKGWVKTGLTCIFTHEYIYIYNENKLDPIVQNYHLVLFSKKKLSFSFLCLPFNTNKRTHKQKHSQIKEYRKKKILDIIDHIKLSTSFVLSRMKILKLN